MSDNGIVWEEPTPAANRRDWAALLAPLMERPEQWARVAEMSPRVAGTVVTQLHRRVRRYPPGRWEFTSRTVDGKGFIYARYLGSEDEQR